MRVVGRMKWMLSALVAAGLLAFATPGPGRGFGRLDEPAGRNDLPGRDNGHADGRGGSEKNRRRAHSSSLVASSNSRDALSKPAEATQP